MADVIKLTNVLVDILDVTEEVQDHINTMYLSSNLSSMIEDHHMLRWYNENEIGQYIAKTSKTGIDNVSATLIIDRDSSLFMENKYQVYIWAWLTEQQIDSIRIAYFKELPQKGRQHKYLYE